jgi:glycosyltransferase involved in cell wall biosynthesis
MAAAVKAHAIVPPSKLRVILNGIDTECFRWRGESQELRQALGIPDSAPVLGTVGRLTEVKQQHLLIRAFARVRERVPKAHLILVGDGPLMGELRSLASQLGVGSVTHLVGYRPEPQRYLPLLDVFALTSSSEGIPQALLEASSAGIPAVASRVGGVPEVIDDGRTGLLFSNGDQNALTAGILALLTDLLLARRMGAAARDRVESLFHIRRMAREYHEQFLELLWRKGWQGRSGTTPTRDDRALHPKNFKVAPEVSVGEGLQADDKLGRTSLFSEAKISWNGL